MSKVDREKTCFNCRHWCWPDNLVCQPSPVDKTPAECRVNAPVSVVHSGDRTNHMNGAVYRDSEILSMWPKTTAQDWCGRWDAKGGDQ